MGHAIQCYWTDFHRATFALTIPPTKPRTIPHLPYHKPYHEPYHNQTATFAGGRALEWQKDSPASRPQGLHGGQSTARGQPRNERHHLAYVQGHERGGLVRATMLRNCATGVTRVLASMLSGLEGSRFTPPSRLRRGGAYVFVKYTSKVYNFIAPELDNVSYLAAPNTMNTVWTARGGTSKASSPRVHRRCRYLLCLFTAPRERAKDLRGAAICMTKAENAIAGPFRQVTSGRIIFLLRDGDPRSLLLLVILVYCA